MFFVLIISLFLALVSSRGYSNRGYSNRGYSNRGYSDRGYSNRGYSDRGGNRYGGNRRSRSSQEGYVAHGVNVFNEYQIYDMSPLVNSPIIDGNLYELGIYNPNGPMEENPTSSTDEDRLISTTRVFTEFFPFPIIDTDLYNIPVFEVGTSYIFSTALNDRLIPKLFEDAEPFGDLFWEKNTVIPTKGLWDKASGQLTVEETNNGLYKITVEICNAIPNGLYTNWEAGIRNPLQNDEEFIGVAAGGLPNVIFADDTGYGKRTYFSKRDPREPCVPESGAVCTLYISAFYHWDAMVYGGGFAFSSQGLAAGILGSNHVFFGFQGDTFFDPPNSFRQCMYRRQRYERYSDSD